MAPESRARRGRPALAEPAIDQAAIDALLAGSVEDLGRSTAASEGAPDGPAPPGNGESDALVAALDQAAIDALFASEPTGTSGSLTVAPIEPAPADLGLDQAAIDALFASEPTSTPGSSAVAPIEPAPADLGLDQAAIDALFADPGAPA